MEQRRVMQPASREQIVAIIRQRAERHRDRVANIAQAMEDLGGAAPIERRRIVENRGFHALRAQAIADDIGAAAANGAGPPAGGGERAAPYAVGERVMVQFVRGAQGGAGGNAQDLDVPGVLPPMEPILHAVHGARGGGGGRAQNAEGDGPPLWGPIAPIFPMGPMMHGGMANLFRQAPIAKEEDAPRTRNVSVHGGVVSYKAEPEHAGAPGVYVSGKNLSMETNYFELEILNTKGATPLTLSIGIVSRLFSLENLPGRFNDTYAFCPGDGVVYRGSAAGSPFGPKAEVGDKIGCGIKFSSPTMQQQNPKNPFSLAPSSGQLFFTHNSREIGSLPINVPPGGFFPAISISNGESFSLRSGLRYIQEEDIMMMVDNCDDDWLSLHDIRLNGPILEYIGRGKSLVDVGLAQAKHPISTRHHYFEIEIVDPGLRCYIAIGLTRKDYPKNRHPGWNRGSIAYHADDGKVFVGSGVGAPFGPRCHKGDIMGCGVIFPRNFEYRSDSDDELETASSSGGGPSDSDPFQLPGVGAIGGGGPAQNFSHFDYPSDSADDEDCWADRNFLPCGIKVHIYFTRNGSVIGKREVRIPKGGFYPTVGMMSSEEKVRVDLRPLSG